MTNYDIYDGTALKEAFEAANAGMMHMARSHQHQIDDAHIQSAKEFINSAPVFEMLRSETPVHAANIRSSLETYFQTRPDQDMDAISMSLVHRWALGFADSIQEHDDPDAGNFPGYDFPDPHQTGARLGF